MAKRISEKIVTKHTFNIEGLLDVENLNEDTIKLDVEDEGTVDVFRWLKSFDGKYIKISISETTEEVPEL